MRLRPVEPADLAALDSLFEVIAECDGHFPIGEHKYLDLVTGVGQVQGMVGEDDTGLVAYVAVTPPRGDDGVAALEVAIHPMHRSHSVISDVIRHGTDQAGQTGADSVRIWAFQPNLVDELRASGFTPERELRQLRIDLPLAEQAVLPPDMTESRFRPGVDEDAWLAVNNAAFTGHPENGRWTREILADRMAQPWFDPEGFVTVWSDQRLAGFCWTKSHDEMGEIYVIAVAPGFQRRGLGRFLVVRGLEVIERNGFAKGMLYMDADNVGAAELYASLGFRLHHVDRSLIRTLG